MTADGPIADATDLADLVRRKEASPVELVDEAIARAEALDPQLNFLVGSTFEQARERAASGSLAGPFAGVPFLVKDMFDVAGVPTRWGTRATELLPPAAANSPQVDAFEAAGLVVIGKSSLGEIGFLPTTEPVAFGPTRNPWDLSRSPGGSSGGAAAAVAAGVVPMADAADGGGSIRIPAAACGLFGLKPSRGRLVGDLPESAGVALTAEHCISRSVRDSAALFAAMEAPCDAAGLPPVGLVTRAAERPLRIGYLRDGLSGRTPTAPVLTALEEAGRLLEGLGHVVAPTAWPLDTAALQEAFATIWASGAGDVVALVEALTGQAPGPDVLEPFTLSMAELARGYRPEDLDGARAVVAASAAAYDRWFEDFDVIVSPVLLQPPVPIGHITGEVPLDVLLENVAGFVDHTVIHNVVGAPAMSVPLHWTADGLPIGTQFAARAGHERVLFELAYQLEAARPWNHRRPPTFAGTGRPSVPGA